MWSTDAITQAALEGITSHEAALRDEQAVAGLDALEEVELHPIVASGLSSAGFGVLRERAYPHEWTRKVVERSPHDEPGLPKPRDRQRCDLVLTEHPGQELVDELAVRRERGERVRAARGTLFESHASIVTAGSAERADGRRSETTSEDAYWLEVKLVRQFDLSSGAPGFNVAYSSELVGSVSRDLKKLGADKRIVHAGVLLVLFTQDASVSEHDLGVMLHTLIDRGVGVRSATVRSFPIVDRIGNGLCTICLVGARGGG